MKASRKHFFPSTQVHREDGDQDRVGRKWVMERSSYRASEEERGFRASEFAGGPARDPFFYLRCRYYQKARPELLLFYKPTAYRLLALAVEQRVDSRAGRLPNPFLFIAWQRPSVSVGSSNLRAGCSTNSLSIRPAQATASPSLSWPPRPAAASLVSAARRHHRCCYYYYHCYYRARPARGRLAPLATRPRPRLARRPTSPRRRPRPRPASRRPPRRPGRRRARRRRPRGPTGPCRRARPVTRASRRRRQPLRRHGRWRRAGRAVTGARRPGARRLRRGL